MGINNRYHLLIILILLGFFILSCDDSQVKTTTLTKLPPILQQIKNNNHQIPSFSCKLSMASNTGRKRVSADGIAYIDKKQKRIKILLTDTLANETLLDLVMIKNKIKLFLFNQDKGVLIFGNLKKLKLSNYIRDFNIDLVDLVNLVSGKSLIFDKVNQIKTQDKKNSYIYFLYKDNKAEILSVEKTTKKIKELVLFKDRKKIFKIHYKKYTQYKKFYFPLRTDFYHNPRTETDKTIISISSSIKFSPKFTNKHFQLNETYNKAKKIFDSN